MLFFTYKNAVAIFFSSLDVIFNIHIFCLCFPCQVLLLIYTVIPLPLYLTVIMSLLYTATFEILNGLIIESEIKLICVRLGLHLCIHLIGAHIMIMTQVRTDFHHGVFRISFRLFVFTVIQYGFSFFFYTEICNYSLTVLFFLF